MSSAYKFPFGCVALLAGLLFQPAGNGLAADGARPNILLILADDLGFSDLGSYGGEIQTPNLDQLAREGVRFTQFYNAAVCVTSRASLLTGLYHRRAPGGFLGDNMVTLSEALQASGYATCAIGKWHLGSAADDRPNARGFEEFYGILDGSADHFDPTTPPPFSSSKRRKDFFHNQEAVTEFPKDFYSTDAYSNHAIEMIRRSQGEDRPFFIYLSYTAPHFPIQAPAETVKKYQGRYREGYDRLRQARFARQIDLGLIDPAVTKLTPADRKTGDFRYDYDLPVWESLTPADREREEQRMEVYAAMVDRLDQGVGRVLAALESTGAAANTVVMFLSDNGGCGSYLPERADELFRYNRGLPVSDPSVFEFVGPGWGWAQNAPFRRFKVWTYEGGISTPLIVRWRGVTLPGTMTHQAGHIVDLMPTLLKAAGADYPVQRNALKVPPMEGEDLRPVLRGGPASPRKMPFYWEVWGNRALRDGDWKIVWGASDRKWELYNMAEDRAETVDLATVYPERFQAMITHWESSAQAAGWTPSLINDSGP
jgi:arylsulfatase